MSCTFPNKTYPYDDAVCLEESVRTTAKLLKIF